jgi:RimJ/RimL family protein N-acetyltransferase
MSSLLPGLLAELRNRGINEVGAAINVNNNAARKVLTYSGFRFAQRFDARQDFYHYRPAYAHPNQFQAG